MQKTSKGWSPPAALRRGSERNMVRSETNLKQQHTSSSLHYPLTSNTAPDIRWGIEAVLISFQPVARCYSRAETQYFTHRFLLSCLQFNHIFFLMDVFFFFLRILDGLRVECRERAWFAVSCRKAASGRLYGLAPNANQGNHLLESVGITSTHLAATLFHSRTQSI